MPIVSVHKFGIASRCTKCSEQHVIIRLLLAPINRFRTFQQPICVTRSRLDKLYYTCYNDFVYFRWIHTKHSSVSNTYIIINYISINYYKIYDLTRSIWFLILPTHGIFEKHEWCSSLFTCITNDTNTTSEAGDVKSVRI